MLPRVAFEYGSQVMSSRAGSGAKPQLGLAISVAALVAACSGTGESGSSGARVNRPLFTEDQYGVSTSPRMSDASGRMPKGGGGYKLGSPYRVAGRWYVPREEPGYDHTGIGSWYGDDFHGRKTANGEIFDRHALTAAHPTMPLPSYAYVTNMENGRTVLVRVNDRGPYVRDRIIDLSHAAARTLGYEGQGRAMLRVRYAGRAPLNGDDRRERQFLAQQRWNGGQGIAEAAQPRYPVRVADASPASWSATSYRAGLAGKALPTKFANGNAPGARDVVSSALPPPDLAPRDLAPPDFAPPDFAPAPRSALGATQRASYGTPGGLVWNPSPPSRPMRDSLGATGALKAVPPVSSRDGQAYVQVGLFREASRAERLRAELGQLGPVEVAGVDEGEGLRYRVRIGPMTPPQAEQTLAVVNARGVNGCRVVFD